MSVTELVRLAKVQRVDLSGCVEKSDMVGRLLRNGVHAPASAIAAAVAAAAPASPTAAAASGRGDRGRTSTSDGGDEAWQALPIGALRKECLFRGIDTSGCVEKADLIARLRQAGAPTPSLGRGEPVAAQAAELRSAVSACDVDHVRALLRVLGDQRAGVLQQVDNNGRTILHVCAARAVRPGAADIAALLLESDARADVADAAGQTPLGVAVATAVATLDGDALATVRVLLRAGPPAEAPAEWRLAGGALARASASSIGRAVVDALCVAGVELPWYDATRRLQPDEVQVAAMAAAAETRDETKGAEGEALTVTALEAMSVTALTLLAVSRGLDVGACMEQADLIQVLLRSQGASGRERGEPADDERRQPLIVPTADDDADDDSASAGSASDDAEEIDMEAAWRAQQSTTAKSTAEAAGGSDANGIGPCGAAPAAAEGTGPSNPIVCSTLSTDAPLRSVESPGAQLDSDAEMQAPVVAAPFVGASASAAEPGADDAFKLPAVVSESGAGHRAEAAAPASAAGSAQTLDIASAARARPVSHLDARDVDAGIGAIGVASPRSGACHAQSSTTARTTDRSVAEAGTPGASPGKEPARKPPTLRAAVRCGDADAVSTALAKLGADGARAAVDGADGTGRTLLHVCAAGGASAGASEIVRLLVASKASTETRDTMGKLPLELAVFAALEAVTPAGRDAAKLTLRSLLEAGASPLAPRSWLDEECALAACCGEPAGREVAEVLLDAGACLPWHPASLHSAAAAGDEGRAREALARFGAAATAGLDAEGRAPLHACAAWPSRGAGRVVRLLVDAAACAGLRDAAGRTPLQLAVQAAVAPGAPSAEAAVDVVRALLACGASVEESAEEWSSGSCDLARLAPLDSPLVQALMDAGADIAWHPSSLRSCIRACDTEAVRRALVRFGESADEAVLMRDASGGTLLHCCARTAARAGAADVIRLLVERSASVDIGAVDSTGRTPLALAIFCGFEAETEAEERNVADVVSVLLQAGAPVDAGEDEDWRTTGGALARKVAAGACCAIAEALLASGAELPWHPSSLRQGVINCKPGVVERALQLLRDRGPAAVNRADTDGCGGTLLHMCAERASISGAADVAGLLLAHSAWADARDATGRTALAVAVSTAAAANDGRLAALATVRVLVDAGVPDDLLAEWCDEGCALARRAASGAGGEAVAAVLNELGVPLPWFALQNPRLQAQCLNHGVPLDVLGPVTAADIVRMCEDWQAMPVKFLRVECRSRMLPTEDCVERGELEALLRTAAVLQACEAIQRPEARLVGRWCYGSKPVEYKILRDAVGRLRFEGPHATCGVVCGLLQSSEDGVLQTVLASSEGVEVGAIRLRYFQRSMTILSNFKSVTMSDWGRDIAARKVMDVRVGYRGEAAPPAFGKSPPSEQDEEVGTKGDDGSPRSAATDAAPEAPEGDIDTTEALPLAFMFAVERHDLDAVERGLYRARREGGDEDVEGLVCVFDADGNNLLHRLAARAAASEASGASVASIARLLLDASAAVNECNLLGETPLLTAVRASGAMTHVGLVRVLLAHSADPTHSDALTGETALMESACRGDLGICRLLLEGDADPTQKNSHGLTARDLAAENGHKRVTDLLRAACPAGVDANIMARSEALWEAVRACDAAAVITELSSLGADADPAIRATNGIHGGGLTLLHVCAERAAQDGSEQVAAALLEHAARVDVCDADGRRPLAIALYACLAAGEAGALALGVLRAFMEAGAPAESDLDFPLPESSHPEVLAAVCNVLEAFGTELPRAWCDVARTSQDTDEPSDPAPQTCETAQGPNVPEPPSTEEGDGKADSCETDIGEDEVGQGMPGQHEDELKGPAMQTPETARGSDGTEARPSTEEGDAKVDDGGDICDAHIDEDELREQCSRFDVPLDVIGADAASVLVRDCARWRGMSLKDLRAACESEEVPTADCIEKSEFVARLRKVRIWHVMPREALLEECLIHGASVAVDFSTRDDLVNALREKAGCPAVGDSAIRKQCKEGGIPVELMTLEDAKEILDAVRSVEALKIAELKRVYERWGMVLEAGMEKADVIRNLTEIFVWQCLPLDELRRICRSKDVPASGVTQREELVTALIAASWPTTGQGQSASRYKNFFDYGHADGASRRKAPPGPPPQQQQRPQPQAQPPPWAYTQPDEWESRAAWNRAQYQGGNRNHPGMPTGSRRWATAGGRGNGNVPPPWGQQAPQPPPPPPKRQLPNVDKDFAILGLPPSASHNEVRKAYRKLALKYHPDKNPGKSREPAERVFREVQRAYDEVCTYLREKGVVTA